MVNVGLNHERVTAPAQGRARLFSRDRMAALHDQMVDPDKKSGAQEAHVVHQRLAVAALLVPDVRMAEEPAQRLVLVRQLVEPVEVAAQPLLDHAHHQDPPHLHARPADLPVDAGKHVLVHEREQPRAESLVGTEMLEPDEKGGDVVPGLEVQVDVLDADLAEFQLRIDCLSHACLAKNCRNQPELRKKARKTAPPARSSNRRIPDSLHGVNSLRIFGQALRSPLGGTSGGPEKGFHDQPAGFHGFSGPAAARQPVIFMGTFRSGFTPRSWKARFWTGVGLVTTDSRLTSWSDRRSWFSAIPERSSSRVRKLWAGRSSAVRLVAAFRRCRISPTYHPNFSQSSRSISLNVATQCHHGSHPERSDAIRPCWASWSPLLFRV